MSTKHKDDDLLQAITPMCPDCRAEMIQEEPGDIVSIGTVAPVYRCSACGFRTREPNWGCRLDDLVEVSDLKAEVRYWKAVAIYLAQCHAANLGIALLHKTSKSERKRLASIMQTCCRALTGKFRLSSTAFAIDDVLRGLKSALKELRSQYDLEA